MRQPSGTSPNHAGNAIIFLLIAQAGATAIEDRGFLGLVNLIQDEQRLKACNKASIPVVRTHARNPVALAEPHLCTLLTGYG